MAALCVRMPEDPFSDYYAEPVLLDSGDRIDSGTDIHSTTLRKDAVVTVPIIQQLPTHSQWSPSSSDSKESNSSTFEIQPLRSPKSIKWTPEDLMYFLTILNPNICNTTTILIQPPLHILVSIHGPIHLKLYSQSSATVPTDAYSVHHPIGTGRPNTTTLLAQSSPHCTTPAQAIQSLAECLLLSNPIHVSTTLDQYNVLAALFTSSSHTLHSLYRGMIEMLGIDTQEWRQRMDQLGGKVDGESALEARFEHYLLGLGQEKLGEWLASVEICLEMGEEERREMGVVYGDSAAFLGMAVEGVWKRW